MADLSEEQKAELLDTMERMRRVVRAQHVSVHGWSLIVSVRRDKTKGDMCVITPSGEKIYSMIGLKRKLGLAPSATAPPVARGRQGSPKHSEPACASQPIQWDSLVLPEGRLRARAVINYAEIEGPSAPQLKSLVLQQVGHASHSDAVQIAIEVHATGDREGPSPPFKHVCLALRALLRSGQLRRELVPSPSGDPSLLGSLVRMLWRALQVEEAEQAAWRVHGRGEAHSLFVQTADEEWSGLGDEGGNGDGAKRVREDGCGSTREEAEGGVRGVVGDGVRRNGIEGVNDGRNEAVKGLGGEEVKEEASEGLRRECGEAVEGDVSLEVTGEGVEAAETDCGEVVEHRAVHIRCRGLSGGEVEASTPSASEETEEDGSDALEDYAPESGSDEEFEESDDKSVQKRKRLAEERLVWGKEPPFVERLTSLAELRLVLPLNEEPSTFHAPEGWVSRQVTGMTRRPKTKWVREDAAGRVIEECERRDELEQLLERRRREEDAPYLGHLVDGTWEISARALNPALTHILQQMATNGLVRHVSSDVSGLAADMFCIRNLYMKGTPFLDDAQHARPKRAKHEQKDPAGALSEDEAELAEVELQRRENIKRNKEMLQQLGLA